MAGIINKIKIDTDERNIGVDWSNIANRPNYAGSSSAGGPATSANTLLTKSSSAEAELFVTFVDNNNSTAANESVYTDGDLKYNPSTNTLTATSFFSNKVYIGSSSSYISYNSSTGALEFNC